MDKPVDTIECKEREREPNSRALVNGVRITNQVPLFVFRFLGERFGVSAKRICFSLTEHALKDVSSPGRTLRSKQGQKLCFIFLSLKKK